MKTFITTWVAIIATLFPTLVFGGLPPTRSAGQSGTLSTTFDFKTPYNQVTKYSGTGGLIETGSYQIAKNPGFEAQTYSTSWATTGGTLAAATSTNIFFSKGATWNSSAASQEFSSDLATVPEGFVGNNCEGSIYIKVPSGTATHTIRVVDNSSNVKASATVINSTYFTKNTLNFPCPASGTSIALQIISVASDEPLVALDEAYLGLARNVGTADLITEWRAFTPSYTNIGFSTFSSNVGYWRRNGTNLEVTQYFDPATGSGSASSLSVAIPTDAACTPDTTKFGGTNVTGIGEYFFWNAAGGVAGEAGGKVRYVSSTSVAFVTSATGGFLTNAMSTTDDAFTTNYSIPCTGWAASTTVMPNAQGLSWSGLHAGDCTWTTTSATFASPSADASCTFTERTNRNFGTVSSEGSKLPGIVFTPRVTGTYFVCATAHGYNSAASGYVAFSLRNSTTSTNIATAGRREGSSGGLNDEQPMTMCGLTVISSAASTTITILMLASSGTSTLVSNSSANAIEWTIFNADQPTQAILANSVSTFNTNGSFVFGAGVTAADCTSTPCTLYDGSTPGITITRASTGVYSLNYASLGITKVPTCSISHNRGSGDYKCDGGTANTTSMTIFCYQNTTGSTWAAIDSRPSAVCQVNR